MGFLPGSHIEELDDLAAWYWWHRHRTRMVVQLAARYLPARAPLAGGYLDVGCGPGSTTRRIAEALARKGIIEAPEESSVIGWDVDARMGPYCRKNRIEFYAADIQNGPLPAPNRPIKLFTILDVLEHVEYPDRLLRNLAARVDAGSIGIVTVPAFNWLYSDWDAALGHHRRYDLRELRALLRKSGYEVLWASYLYSFAFLPAALMRRRGKVARPGSADFPKVPKPVNWILRGVSRGESLFLRCGRLPFGTSAIAVVRRS